MIFKPARSRHLLIAVAMVFASLALVQGCGGGGSTAPPPLQGSGPERVDQAMTGVMDRWAPPGIAVAVVRQGRLVIARAYGSADLAGREALRPDHLFRVASVSKPVTAIAALKAADEGLLDVQSRAFDALSGYLPGDGSEDPRLADITVWHLLHHTAGFNQYGFPSDPLFRHKEISQALMVPMPLVPDSLTRWIATQPLAFDPGTGFSYTNIGYVVLGRVLEASTGFGYEEFVRRFVLEPAGITRGRLAGIARSQRLDGEVEYESFRNDIWTSVHDGETEVREPAYGGLNLIGFDASSAWVLSVVDMARLAAATDGDAAYPELLTPGRFQQMISVGTPRGTTEAGAGWFLITSSGTTTGWNHAGGMPGTTAYLARMPEGIIVAAVANTAREDSFFQALAGGLETAVRGISDWPEVDLFDAYP